MSLSKHALRIRISRLPSCIEWIRNLIPCVLLCWIMVGVIDTPLFAYRLFPFEVQPAVDIISSDGTDIHYGINWEFGLSFLTHHWASYEFQWGLNTAVSYKLNGGMAGYATLSLLLLNPNMPPSTQFSLSNIGLYGFLFKQSLVSYYRIDDDTDYMPHFREIGIVLYHTQSANNRYLIGLGAKLPVASLPNDTIFNTVYGFCRID